LRYRLLASAGLAVLALTAAVTPASAEDCGCREQVRAALKRQHPAANAPARRAPAAQAQAQAGAAYDYRDARPVDMQPYRHRWEEAPQGPVAPPTDYGYAPPAHAVPMHYSNPAYPDGWAYGYQAPAIQIDQDGWFGGVGYYAAGDGGGGGGGGGMTLTLSQPDSLNGPSYNSFGQSYGGPYGAANQLNAWRAQAFAPKPSGGGGGN